MANLSLINFQTNTILRIDESKVNFISVHADGVFNLYTKSNKHYLVKEDPSIMKFIKKAPVQLTFFQAEPTGEERMNEGIKKAFKSARDVDKDWVEKAFYIAKIFIDSKEKGDKFMFEDVRHFATTNNLIPKPPSNRSWGGIARKIGSSGLVTKMGYAPVKNPKANMAMAALWSKN